MRRPVVLVVCLALAACGGKKGASSSKEVRVAAAADLARAFEELAPAFEKATGIKAIVTPGSTGLLAKQIAEKAPFDLFAAANVAYVEEVVKAGACDGATQQLYARGRLVVWSLGDGAPKTFAELADPKYKKIGIANPDHAPYGKAAKQALERAGIWDQVKDRVTFGENVQVPMQWAKAGEVDAAIVALSLAVVADGGSSIPVDTALHDALDQMMVVCGTGPGTEAAKKFQAYVDSAAGREIMTRYGFLLPGETAPTGKGGTGGDRDGSGTGSDATAPAPVDRLPKEDVQALVDKWLDAQNTDDFAAYGALYADRFAGIKRVGPRTWTFDRKGWLADRGRMFTAAKMTVTVDGTEISPLGKMAVVRFTQTFQQAKFKDTGAKQLIVVTTPDGLRIAREEMLASSMVDPKSEVPDGMLVVGDEAGTWLLLGGAYDAETKGRPQSGGGGDGFDYSTHTKLAEPHRLVGAEVTLYPSGAKCKIAEVSVMSMLTPHFGTVMVWKGDEDGDGVEDSKPLTDAQIDAEVESAGSSYLAADVSACGGGDVGTLKPATAWADATGVPEVEAAEQAFEKLPGYVEIQEEFETSYDGKGPWTEAEEGSTTSSAFTGPNGRTLIVVSATAGYGCGSFSAALVAVFEAANGKVKLLGLADGTPETLVDLDGDSQPELIGEHAIYAFDGDAFTLGESVDLGYADCPC